MIEKYMEKELVRKVKIINLLWEKEELTSIDLASTLEVTATTVKSDIKALNLYYCSPNNPLIVSSASGYSILNKPQRNKRAYLKTIYNDSLFIRACCYNLKHNFSEIETFAEEEFISLSKAYDLKKVVLSYIKELDISYFQNELPNNECRIRFLITYFQMKIGIDIIDIPQFNQYHFDELFKEFETTENCLLSRYSKEYASILFQLDYERSHTCPISFDPVSLSLLKSTTVYQRLRKIIYPFLEKEFHTRVSEEHILYYVLVFNIMNANYIDSKEVTDSYNNYVQIIKERDDLHYDRLLSLFSQEFGDDLDTHSLLFEAPLIIFLRKCIFNLQILIPEEHLELGNMSVISNSLSEKISHILATWNKESNLNLLFSDDHIKYLASKIYFLISKRRRTQKIYILTSFYTDYLLAKELLSTEYGALIQVLQFDPKKSSSYDQNDLILHDTEYEILEKTHCQKLQISFIFDLAELQQIRMFLFGYDLSGILKTDIVDTVD